MASIKLKHASGNSTILNSPAANPSSDVTLKLPSTTGSAGQVLKVASANHSATNAELEFVAAGETGRKVTYGSWVSTSSGTEIAFTSIAATTEFAIDFLQVKSASNQNFQTTIGDSGGYETSGYETATGFAGASGNHHDPSASLWKTEGSADAAGERSGRMHLINMYNNYWYMEFDFAELEAGAPYFRFYRGTKQLSGQLDRIKFNWDGGGAFDGGYMRYVKFEDL